MHGQLEFLYLFVAAPVLTGAAAAAVVRLWLVAPAFAAAREHMRAWADGPDGWRRGVGLALTCPACLAAKAVAAAGCGLYLPYWLAPEAAWARAGVGCGGLLAALSVAMLTLGLMEVVCDAGRDAAQGPGDGVDSQTGSGGPGRGAGGPGPGGGGAGVPDAGAGGRGAGGPPGAGGGDQAAG